MQSSLVEPNVVLGVQRPRLENVPPFAASSGDEAVALAELAGLILDPWQQYALRVCLGEKPDGTWAARRFGLCVPRQSGKGSFIEARELAGLFLLGEELLIHSAHEFKTSKEAFRRLETLIRGTPELLELVAPNGFKKSHGEEGIELRSGQRILFATRTGGAFRGFSGDCLILDEAMIFSEEANEAIYPTQAARANPQTIYTGSAVNKDRHPHGIVFSRIRAAGLAGADGTAWLEWSADDALIEADPEQLDNPELWAQANPGLGIRISLEYIRGERTTGLSDTGFMTERLGVGAWYDPDAEDGVFPAEWLVETLDVNSTVKDPVCLAVDVAPGSRAASICAAGWNGDGLSHFEVMRNDPGTGWVVPATLKALAANPDVAGVWLDDHGPGGALVEPFKKAGIDVNIVSAADLAKACGALESGLRNRTLRHLGQPPLMTALKGAEKRPLGDAWAWSRTKSSGTDISPLVACTLALGASLQHKPAERVPLFARGR